jgi:hypothetical protein
MNHSAMDLKKKKGYLINLHVKKKIYVFELF